MRLINYVPGRASAALIQKTHRIFNSHVTNTYFIHEVAEELLIRFRRTAGYHSRADNVKTTVSRLCKQTLDKSVVVSRYVLNIS